MDVLFLDQVPWQRSQSLYHAAGYLNREVLIILRPARPYVSIGYHQNARQEIDLEFTQSAGIPVFRREVGGGAVFLDGQQLFYQLVINPESSGVPADKFQFYEKFLGPVVKTYQDIGIPAVFKPVNDITVNDRKISGNGAAQIGNRLVLVGNFILDFDFATMVRVIHAPDEKFRDKVYQTMTENLTTIVAETGGLPSTRELAIRLVNNYKPLLGEVEWASLDDELAQKADEVFALMNTPEWLFANDNRLKKRTEVKIKDGVSVHQNVNKTPGGLIRGAVVASNGIIANVHFSGDFFFYPESHLADLEKSLAGTPLEREAILSKIRDFYQKKGIQSPGVHPEDLASTILS